MSLYDPSRGNWDYGGGYGPGGGGGHPGGRRGGGRDGGGRGRGGRGGRGGGRGGGYGGGDMGFGGGNFNPDFVSSHFAFFFLRISDFLFSFLKKATNYFLSFR